MIIGAGSGQLITPTDKQASSRSSHLRQDEQLNPNVYSIIVGISFEGSRLVRKTDGSTKPALVNRYSSRSVTDEALVGCRREIFDFALFGNSFNSVSRARDITQRPFWN